MATAVKQHKMLGTTKHTTQQNKYTNKQNERKKKHQWANFKRFTQPGWVYPPFTRRVCERRCAGNLLKSTRRKDTHSQPPKKDVLANCFLDVVFTFQQIGQFHAVSLIHTHTLSLSRTLFSVVWISKKKYKFPCQITTNWPIKVISLCNWPNSNNNSQARLLSLWFSLALSLSRA